MGRIHVESERIVNARPEEVYEILKDYKEKRPQILTPNFLDYTVEKGGKGSGTVVRYRLQAARRERPYQMVVDEPVKGKVITERDTNSSLVTTWRLAPLGDGRQTKVHVESEWEGGKGVGGFFERTFAPLGLRRIYRQMLDLLAPQVQPKGAHGSSHLFQDEDRSIAANLGVRLLFLGLVLGFAVIITIIQRSRKRES